MCPYRGESTCPPINMFNNYIRSSRCNTKEIQNIVVCSNLFDAGARTACTTVRVLSGRVYSTTAVLPKNARLACDVGRKPRCLIYRWV